MLFILTKSVLGSFALVGFRLGERRETGRELGREAGF